MGTNNYAKANSSDINDVGSCILQQENESIVLYRCMCM